MEIIEEEQEQTLNKKEVRSQVWRVKQKVDDEQDYRSLVAPINMVFIMPKEFMAPAGKDEEPELEEDMAQLNLEPVLRNWKMTRGNI